MFVLKAGLSFQTIEHRGHANLCLTRKHFVKENNPE